ncbi:hypothetical protein DL96DRAFT_1600681 [Flagelloscypha sp. PMI_526]|nr:hypothetical protein DL96DRAFT_1600681 [Flagelloscypha sp. PMI_526]
MITFPSSVIAESERFQVHVADISGLPERKSTFSIAVSVRIENKHSPLHLHDLKTSSMKLSRASQRVVFSENLAAMTLPPDARLSFQVVGQGTGLFSGWQRFTSPKLLWSSQPHTVKNLKKSASSANEIKIPLESPSNPKHTGMCLNIQLREIWSKMTTRRLLETIRFKPRKLLADSDVPDEEHDPSRLDFTSSIGFPAILGVTRRSARMVYLQLRTNPIYATTFGRIVEIYGGLARNERLTPSKATIPARFTLAGNVSQPVMAARVSSVVEMLTSEKWLPSHDDQVFFDIEFSHCHFAAISAPDISSRSSMDDIPKPRRMTHQPSRSLDLSAILPRPNLPEVTENDAVIHVWVSGKQAQERFFRALYLLYSQIQNYANVVLRSSSRPCLTWRPAFSKLNSLDVATYAVRNLADSSTRCDMRNTFADRRLCILRARSVVGLSLEGVYRFFDMSLREYPQTDDQGLDAASDTCDLPPVVVTDYDEPTAEPEILVGKHTTLPSPFLGGWATSKIGALPNLPPFIGWRVL